MPVLPLVLLAIGVVVVLLYAWSRLCAGRYRRLGELATKELLRSMIAARDKEIACRKDSGE